MEVETVENVAKGTAFSLFSAEMMTLFWDLRWLIALAVCLIIVDGWLGISESRMKKVEIRKSKAGRRTMNKIVDYICYLMLGGILGMAIGEPLGVNHIAIAAVSMLIACLFEIDSIAGHYCELHGIRNRFSVKKFIISLVKKKNKDVGEALEESINNNEEKAK